MNIAVATWNTEWATPSSDRGPRISAILRAADADIVVLTEGVRELLPADGFAVDAGDDWGYGRKPSRRKVIVWSRFPLTLDSVGERGGARGRLAVATVHTPDGPMRVVGVCIPWRDAHVNTGRGDARPWSEHLDHLDQLAELLPEFDDGVPTVIAGDFNQRIPRDRQPIRVADRLSEVFAAWTIHTTEALPNGPHIDHIATNDGLLLESVRDWGASDGSGRLSDHAGVVCRFRHAQPATQRRDSAVPSESTDTPKPKNLPSPGRLTPELRAEIENVLRRSGDGLSHGATFRLREQGLSDAEIAAERGVGVDTTRTFLLSLDALLTGTLPTTKSLAETNSYVYRELLNHPRSENLDSYVKAQLRKLKDINPSVKFEPLQTRKHQYRVGKRKQERPSQDSCPECAAIGIIHSGRCE